MRSSFGPETPSPRQVAKQDFSALYQQEHDAQVRRAYLILGDGGVAHDVVAEAFLVVLQRWADLDNPGTLVESQPD